MIEEASEAVSEDRTDDASVMDELPCMIRVGDSKRQTSKIDNTAPDSTPKGEINDFNHTNYT